MEPRLDDQKVRLTFYITDMPMFIIVWYTLLLIICHLLTCFYIFLYCKGSLTINKKMKLEVKKQKLEIKLCWNKRVFISPWFTTFDRSSVSYISRGKLNKYFWMKSKMIDLASCSWNNFSLFRFFTIKIKYKLRIHNPKFLDRNCFSFQIFSDFRIQLT